MLACSAAAPSAVLLLPVLLKVSAVSAGRRIELVNCIVLKCQRTGRRVVEAGGVLLESLNTGARIAACGAAMRASSCAFVGVLTGHPTDCDV